MFRLCRLATIATVAALLFTLAPAAWAQQVIVPPNEPPTARTVMLAKFHFANDNEFHVLYAPELGEILAGEYTNAGPNEQFFINPEMSLAQVFLLLAPADTPVPRAIAQLDEHGLLAGRPIVEALEETIEVPMAVLGMTQKSIPVGSGQGSCQLDDPGADFFEDHHCYTGGGPGYGASDPDFCHKDSSNSIDEVTDSKRRATYTRMASCGGGMNRFRHLYGTVSGWETQVNVYVDPQKVVSWWSAKTGVKRHRRVIFEDHEAAGWVRGWAKFHSEVAGGW